MSTEAHPVGGLTATAQRRGRVITALGIAQILAWGSSYYLPAVLAQPIVTDTGWSLTWIVGGLSIGLLVSGLVSPHVGRMIEHRGGRPVLVASALLLSLGLLGLGLAQNLPIYVGSWIVMGLGMGAGLYDPAFATLGRLYGTDARRAITILTLFGGLACTVCWPLSALLTAELGWRGACLAYAAIQLGLSLPIYLFAVPREPVRPLRSHEEASIPMKGGENALPGRPERVLLIMLVAAALTVGAMISTLMSVYILTILQSRGVDLAQAVALGTLVGPSQVGARFIEMLVARFHHPIWTKVASVSHVATGMIALWVGLPITPFGLVLYGAGIGLESIARGTLPLALFGAEGYAALMGRLALPSLIAQAAAPSIGSILMEHFGIDATLGAVILVAIGNVALCATLDFCRARHASLRANFSRRCVRRLGSFPKHR